MLLLDDVSQKVSNTAILSNICLKEVKYGLFDYRTECSGGTHTMKKVCSNCSEKLLLILVKSRKQRKGILHGLSYDTEDWTVLQ